MPEYSTPKVTPTETTKIPGMNGNSSGYIDAKDLLDIIRATFGQANGVATLGSDGKLTSSQLPDLADDVIVATSYATLPSPGISGKLYITGDNNTMYRWDDALATPDYVELSVDLSAYATIADLQDGSLEPLISTKARQDQYGNVIDTTYETKAEASELKSAIQSNTARIENLEQEHGGLVITQYRGSNLVPSGKAKNAKVTSTVGKSRGWNNPLQNGNFASDSTWANQACSFSVSNNEGHITNISNNNHVMLRTDDTTILKAGKAYIASFQYKSNMNSIQCKARSASEFLATYTTSTSWQTATMIFTQGASNEYFSPFFRDENDYVSGLEMDFRKCLVRELNPIFPEYSNAQLISFGVSGLVKICPDLLTYDSYGYSLVDTEVEGVESRGFNLWNGQYESGLYYPTTGAKVADANSVRCKNLIPVPRCSTIYLMATQNLVVGEWDADGNYLANTFNGKNTTLTLRNDTAYISFYSSVSVDTASICINISGSLNGTYKAWVNPSTLSLPTSVILRSAGSGVNEVADTLDPQTGEIIRRVEKRAYASGDESDATVTTDGSTWTNAPITATEDTPIAPVNPMIPTEGGGTINTQQTQSPVIDNCLDVAYLAL